MSDKMVSDGPKVTKDDVKCQRKENLGQNKSNLPALSVSNAKGTIFTQDLNVDLQNIEDSKIRGISSTFERSDSVASSPEQAQAADNPTKASIMLDKIEGSVITGATTKLKLVGSKKADIVLFATEHK